MQHRFVVSIKVSLTNSQTIMGHSVFINIIGRKKYTLSIFATSHSSLIQKKTSHSSPMSKKQNRPELQPYTHQNFQFHRLLATVELLNVQIVIIKY